MISCIIVTIVCFSIIVSVSYTHLFQQKADDVKDEVVYIIDNSSNDVDWAHRVIPETVGQFTGVTDKKGNRVFEGSIFRYEPHFTTEKACLGIVKSVSYTHLDVYKRQIISIGVCRVC